MLCEPPKCLYITNITYPGSLTSFVGQAGIHWDGTGHQVSVFSKYSVALSGTLSTLSMKVLGHNTAGQPRLQQMGVRHGRPRAERPFSLKLFALIFDGLHVRVAMGGNTDSSHSDYSDRTGVSMRSLECTYDK